MSGCTSVIYHSEFGRKRKELLQYNREEDEKKNELDKNSQTEVNQTIIGSYQIKIENKEGITLDIVQLKWFLMCR